MDPYADALKHLEQAKREINKTVNTLGALPLHRDQEFAVLFDQLMAAQAEIRNLQKKFQDYTPK